MSPGPSLLLLAHLKILGRWCPGWSGRDHHADDLTAESGRVLCRDCSATVIRQRRATDGEF